MKTRFSRNRSPVPRRIRTARTGLVAAAAAALRAAEERYAAGRGARDRVSVLGAAHAVIDAVLLKQFALPPERRARFEVDYVSLAHPETMEELDAIEPGVGAILSGAIRMLPVDASQPGEDLGHSGGPAVRLIDNIILEPVREG